MELLNTTTAPMLGEIGQGRTEDAAHDSQAVAPADLQLRAKKPPSDFSYKLAKLARKESAILEQKRALDSDLSLANEYRASKESAKQNPIKFLQSLGLSFEDIARFQLEGGEPEPDPISSLKQEIEQMKQRAFEKEEAENQREIQKQTEMHEGRISGFKKQIDTFIESNKDNFEFLNANKDQVETVYDLIELHYKNTNKVMDFKEACQLVEDDIETQFKTKYASLNKIKGLINPNEHVEKDLKPLEFLREPKYESSRPTSLSNQLKPEAPHRKDESEMTPEQRFARAVEMYESGRRGG